MWRRSLALPRGMGRKARVRLVLVRLERAEQHVDRRWSRIRAVPGHLRECRGRDAALAGTSPARAALADRRTCGRRLSAVLDGLGLAFPDRSRTEPSRLRQLAPLRRLAGTRRK